MTEPKKYIKESNEPERSNLVLYKDNIHNGMFVTFATHRFLRDFKTRTICALTWPTKGQRMVLQEPPSALHPRLAAM